MICNELEGGMTVCYSEEAEEELLQILEREIDSCRGCKYGEPCNKYDGYIHCNKLDVSLRYLSKCAKWELRDDI